MLKSLLIVGSGSFVGGALRYLLSTTVQTWIDGWMPAGTLAVNVVGCLLIGLFCGITDQWLSPGVRLFLTVGFCGGFTTFSTLINDSMHLMRLQDATGACLNIIVSLAAGFIALLAGYQAARLI